MEKLRRQPSPRGPLISHRAKGNFLRCAGFDPATTFLVFFSGSLAAPRPPVEDDDRWKELSALAAKEQDPDKLLELVQEINRLLEEKERRHRNQPDKLNFE